MQTKAVSFHTELVRGNQSIILDTNQELAHVEIADGGGVLAIIATYTNERLRRNAETGKLELDDGDGQQ